MTSAKNFLIKCGVICLGIQIGIGTGTSYVLAAESSQSETTSSSDLDSDSSSGQSSSSSESDPQDSSTSKSSSYSSSQSSDRHSDRSQSSKMDSSSDRSKVRDSSRSSASDQSVSRADHVSSSSDRQSESSSSDSSTSSSSITSDLQTSSYVSSVRSSSVKHYSTSELLRMAKDRYDADRTQLVGMNKQSVTANNNKGAKELYAAYQLALKNIRSGKTTLEEREASVASQKSVLQQALSVRLNSLQDTYNQQFQIIQDKINMLPSDHAHDKAAIVLQGQLVSLDYKLSHDSNLAYTRYDKAVAKLNRQAAHASVKSKAVQRKEAKETYMSNLASVNAKDPDSLIHENNKKLHDLYVTYLHVKSLINDRSILLPVDIQKHL